MYAKREFSSVYIDMMLYRSFQANVRYRLVACSLLLDRVCSIKLRKVQANDRQPISLSNTMNSRCNFNAEQFDQEFLDSFYSKDFLIKQIL